MITKWLTHKKLMTVSTICSKEKCTNRKHSALRAVVFALTLTFFTYGCALPPQNHQQFQVIVEGEGFDNALQTSTLSLSFEGRTIENMLAYHEFLQQRKNLPLYGMKPTWESPYTTEIEQTNFQEYILIVVMHEGLINIDSNIEQIHIREVQFVNTTLEVHVVLPEPTTPPCEQPNMLSWLMGGQVCKPMGIYTNSFQIVAVPRSSIPANISTILFIDQHENPLIIYDKGE